MTLPDMPAGPAWLGWVLFAVTVIYQLVSGGIKIRSDNASAKLTELQATQLSLELLGSVVADQSAQLKAIAETLSADAQARPTEAQLAALGTHPMVAHLRSRERARSELPGVVSQLEGIQERRVSLEKRISQRLPVADQDLKQLRDELHQNSSQVIELVQLIAESPSITLSSTPPEGGKDGDIWLDIGQ